MYRCGRDACCCVTSFFTTGSSSQTVKQWSWVEVLDLQVSSWQLLLVWLYVQVEQKKYPPKKIKNKKKKSILLLLDALNSMHESGYCEGKATLLLVLKGKVKFSGFIFLTVIMTLNKHAL